MANTPIIFVPTTVPPGLCFATEQDRYNFFANNLQGYLAGGLTGVIVSTTPPPNPIAGQVWVKVDANGAFVRSYTYSGSWLSLHPAPALGNERRIWTGPLTGVGGLDTYDGGDALPTAITSTTGQFWQPDTAFAFAIPMGAGTNGTSYDGNAATVLAIGGSAGEERHTLGIAEIPAHQHSGCIPAPPTDYTDSSATLDFPSYTGSLTGSTGGTASSPTGGTIGAATLSHQNLPPVIGVTFIRRTARSYYTT